MVYQRRQKEAALHPEPALPDRFTQPGNWTYKTAKKVTQFINPLAPLARAIAHSELSPASACAPNMTSMPGWGWTPARISVPKSEIHNSKNAQIREVQPKY